MPSPLLVVTVLPLSVFVPPVTRMPPSVAPFEPLPLTSFQLTLLLLDEISTPFWLAPLARRALTVWPPPPAMTQPIVPPTESGPLMNSLPVLVMFHTGCSTPATPVTFAFVHCVMLSAFEPSRMRFSTVLENIPITSVCADALASLYAACTSQ